GAALSGPSLATELLPEPDAFGLRPIEDSAVGKSEPLSRPMSSKIRKDQQAAAKRTPPPTKEASGAKFSPAESKSPSPARKPGLTAANKPAAAVVTDAAGRQPASDKSKGPKSKPRVIMAPDVDDESLRLERSTTDTQETR